MKIFPHADFPRGTSSQNRTAGPERMPRRKFFLLWALAGGAMLYAAWHLAGAGRRPPEIENTMAESNASKVRAPELEGGVGWLNTKAPLTLRKELKGKVVLLDFWTYCCINCMHVLPDLKFLERKYPGALAVVGVHSAKFQNERELENIRQAILRYEIEHPVLNDARLAVWQAYGVRAWPTLVLIDPEGYLVGYVSGEGRREVLDETIARLIGEHRAKGTLDETPLAFALEREKAKKTELSFPGKILADAASDRIFIADSNHNRMVIARLDGTVLDIVGEGRAGRRDGAFEEAQFHHPQGMALSADSKTLYAADTENHLLRALDLEKRTVRTIAGTGRQGLGRTRGGPALSTPLSSPWDLARAGDALFIAMAGSHQIWRYDLKKKTCEPFAGSGREDILDGPLHSAALAQPSGLAGDGRRLFFADSEVSAARYVDIESGRVETLVGHGLFEFGDVDGFFEKARFQHPLGILFHEGSVYVADTYNHKIKIITLGEKPFAKTFSGTGKPGAADGALALASFYEPGGLSHAKGKLYVADTNNHRIRVVDPASKKVSTLALKEK